MKKIILTFILACMISFWTSFANLSYDEFWNFFEDYPIVIGCYEKWTTYEPKDWNCRWKNILLPPKSHLQYFKKYFDKQQDGSLMCWQSCFEKIAHRFSLVNFESGFNPNAISASNDYGYIQVNWWKDFLWEHKIQISLDWLDSRWEDHLNSLCIPTYKVNPQNTDQVFKCLLMRHNWQKSLNNWYSLRGLAWKYYYLNYFNKKSLLNRDWKRYNVAINKSNKLIDEKMKIVSEEKAKDKIIETVNKKTDNKIENKVNKVNKIETNVNKWNKEAINYNNLKNEYWSLEKVPFFKLYNELEQDYLDKYVSLEQLDPVSKNPNKKYLWKDKNLNLIKIIHQYELFNKLKEDSFLTINGEKIYLKNSQ